MIESTKPADRGTINSLMAGVKETFSRAAEMREWLTLDGYERRRIAQDLGLSGSDVGTLIAESGGAAELDELLRRNGLQVAAAVHGALPDLQRVCGLCRSRSECRDWLSIPVEARDEAALPHFCPNRQELEMLRDMQGGGCCK